MSIFRSLILYLFLTSFYSISVYGQQKIYSEKQLLKLYNEATINLHKGLYEKSLIQARSLLSHSILAKNNNLTARAYNTIAANFDELTEPEKALFYYKKSLIYAEKTENFELQNWIYNNLGNIYCFNKKQYEKGIHYYIKSLYFSKTTKDTAQILFTKLNIAWAYFDIGSFNEGLPYLEYTNKHYKEYNDNSITVVLYMLNGMYYSHINNNQNAEFNFKKAIESGVKYNEKSDLSFVHQEYAKFLSKNGDFEKAYENLKAYNEITDDFNAEERIRKANVAGINLEIDEFKREIDKIEVQSKQKEKQFHTEKTRNKKIITIMLSLFIISIILFYFFYQNTKLKQKNRIKNIQNKIHQNIINASIDGQENERKKIALFLHDTISASLSSAGMHLNVFLSQHSIVADEIVKTKFILDETHDKVRDLSHDLLPTLLVRFGLLYALDDLCEKNSNSTLHFEYLNNISIKNRYNEKFETRIYFIISELLNNIIKHSEANKAQILLTENPDGLHIQINDNGRGFDINEFNFVEGFGLNQIKARINNMNGQFDVKSKKNHGTSIKIKVPV
ncbi:ATP-binding protein [Flavobacterium piscis]|uniref:histidine kinase n=1 Tax=Flavobacterium piscis TaxID=1114874 RepID=A0ABU1Y7D7_9FLAO|nr:ATP-binding protein [Flavobacterium piscis]MDR7210155.1 signal transduction histidine kinase [Flavobacterium piscis]